MKLKFYLRGIGIGIIVAVAICMSSGMNKKEKLTDAEIKARAEALGMVEESSYLADIQSGAEESADLSESDASVEDVADVIDAGDDESTANQSEDVESDEAKIATDEADTEADTETVDANEEVTPAEDVQETLDEEADATAQPTGETVTVTVDKGNGSDTVARRIADAGLVPDAAEYDRWLIEHGYDRRISAGAHKIPKGASKEEIAKIISSSN